jgi:hypothetical protein
VGFLSNHKVHIQRQKGGDNGNLEAEIGVMWSQQGRPPEARGDKKQNLPYNFRRKRGLVDSLTLDFWSLEL